ncbi:MAG: GDSL-type esterase/lipase family protein [Candidatus Omnitrophica bacterium]|nr:GDSL-type esterase/lipase family protein [Candidatus Omnitrophota bacterium]
MLKNKLKTVALVAIILGFGITALLLNVKREIKNTNSNGKNIICYGDSITFGYGVNPGEDYPTALAKIVNRPVINVGVDGDTSTEGLQRIKQDVLEKEPYIVLIEFTGNDFLKKIPMDLTISNIKEMVREIQGRGAMTAIVDVSAGLFLFDYRVRLYLLARQTGSIFIPATLSGIITNPSMKSDFMHPNASGYKIVAQRVYQTIEPYLNKPQK